MKVKRFSEATCYDAPNHRGFIGLRLQGFEPDGSKNQWVGNSHFLPGGVAVPALLALEKVMSLVGSVTVIIDGVEFVLNPMDSCTVAPNEVREMIDRRHVAIARSLCRTRQRENAASRLCRMGDSGMVGVALVGTGWWGRKMGALIEEESRQIKLVRAVEPNAAAGQGGRRAARDLDHRGLEDGAR